MNTTLIMQLLDAGKNKILKSVRYLLTYVFFSYIMYRLQHVDFIGICLRIPMSKLVVFMMMQDGSKVYHGYIIKEKVMLEI